MNQISIEELANWFLAKESMTHKKLQKVCYYGVAWGWALMDRSVISDDGFQAWVHGPVAPKLYDRYKKNGWNDIPRVAAKDTAKVAGDIADLLESVWITYGEKSGNELEALSHSEKPWIEARAGLESSESSNNPISTDVMAKFYNSIKSTEY